MALGLARALEQGPIPKVEIVDPQNEEVPQSIPMFMPLQGKIMGPADPLSGPTSPDDMSGLVASNDRILNVLEKLLIATRAIHPNASVVVKGPVSLPANSGELYKFDMGGKRIPALNVFIQNNTPQICFVGIEDAAGIGNIQVPANGGIVQIADVAVDFISLWVTALTNVAGVDNMGQPVSSVANPTVNVLIMAWSNGEWSNVWGQTS